MNSISFMIILLLGLWCSIPLTVVVQCLPATVEEDIAIRVQQHYRNFTYLGVVVGGGQQQLRRRLQRGFTINDDIFCNLSLDCNIPYQRNAVCYLGICYCPYGTKPNNGLTGKCTPISCVSTADCEAHFSLIKCSSGVCVCDGQLEDKGAKCVQTIWDRLFGSGGFPTAQASTGLLAIAGLVWLFY